MGLKNFAASSGIERPSIFKTPFVLNATEGVKNPLLK